MHRGLAVLASNSENFDGALAALNIAIQEKPSEETLYLLLAKFNYQDHRLYEANKACDLLLNVTRNRTDTLVWIVTQMKKAKQYGKAVEIIRNELNKDPSCLDYNLQLVELLILSGENREANEKLKILIPAYVENPAALQQISLMFHDMGEEQQALDVFNMSIKGKYQLSPKDYFTHAYLLMVNRKYQDSLDVIQKGIASYPDENNLEVLHTEIYACTRDYDTCFALLQKLHTNTKQININSENQIPDELISRLVDKRHQIVFTKEIGIVYRLAKCYVITKNYRKARELVEHELKETSDDLILLDFLSYLEYMENQSAGHELNQVQFNLHSYDLTTLEEVQINSLSAILARKILAGSQNAPLTKSSTDIMILKKLSKDSVFSRLFTAWEDTIVNEFSVSKIILEQMVLLVTDVIEQQSKADQNFDLCLAVDNNVELSGEILCRVLCENYQWNKALEILSQLALELPDNLSIAKMRIDIFNHWFSNATIANECNISITRKNEFSIAEGFVNEAYKSLDLFNATELKVKNLWLLGFYFKKPMQNVSDSYTVNDKYPEHKIIASIYTQSGDYQKVLDLIPEDYTDLTTMLLKVLAALRLDLPSAINYSEDALSIWPDNPLVLYLYSQVSKKAGLTDNALRSILRAIEVWPDELKWAKEALTLSKELGDTQTELHVLEKLSIQVPGDADLINRMADLYTHLDVTDKAISSLERYLDDHPNDVDTWTHLADLFSKGSNYSFAISTIKQGLKHNPESQLLKIKHGKLLLKTQDYVNSEAVLKQCLKQDPENVLAKYALIDTYLAGNKMQDACLQLDSIPKKTLNTEINAVIYTHLLNAIKGPQFARKFLNDYLEGKSIDLSDRVYLAIAEIDHSEGNHLSAEQNALQAMRINPENSAIHGLLGRINRKLGNLDQAIFYLAKAIEMQDPVLEDLLELGRSYIDRRETRLALEAFKKAIFQYPERPEPYFLTAQVLRECKDYLGAEKMLRKASTLAPGDLTIHRQLGAIIALNLVHNT